MQSSITSFLFYLDERLFTHIANDLNQLVTNLFRFLHRVSFGINTDNRFRIALTQMHPFFREVDLHTIDIGDITPPLPSPPIIALVAFIFVTTFTSPTAAALYSQP